jgi:LmbE family N-acetylglucosaminyl deacetylase
VLGAAGAGSCRALVAALAALVAGLVPRAAGGAETLVVPPRLRLLVVAPHPDDESLAAGGLMQRVLAAGGRVRVLFITDGDGYPEAVAAATGRQEPSARDYRDFGELRRAEALVALERYHVLPSAVTFLGFPDGGLAAIWRRDPRASAYESPYTRRDAPPHSLPFETGAHYERRDLIHLIARLVASFDPDWIVLPTPLDNHPDHCATFAFVVEGLKAVAASKEPGRLLTYLVHASAGWPRAPEEPGPLREPAVRFAPARWFSVPLDENQARTKLDALLAHRTQVAVMERVLRSFARPNELFAVIERAQIASLAPGTPPCGPQPPSFADP